jgi:RND family efflux transporter MFP subunit
MKDAKNPHGPRKVIRAVGTTLAFLAAVILLIAWLAGAFEDKIDRTGPRPFVAEAQQRPVGDRELAPVRMIRVPRTESAVGTVEAVHQTALASKLLARVVETQATAGQRVSQGDVLVRLDDADLQSRLRQAQASRNSATAAHEQARIERDRVRSLFAQQSATQIELDRVSTAFTATEAELERAEQTVAEARTVVGYATIRAPIDGVVVDKHVENGDTVTPGQQLVTLYDPTRMQLVARVRESLTQRLHPGQMIDVRIEALDKACMGEVTEIVPEAETTSRTFTVKVTGPCPPGVYTGMFGRLLIPLDDEPVLVIPHAAVRRIGQLTVVDVADGGFLRRRAIRPGRPIEDQIEVLSGLREGEQVVVHAAG